MKNKIYIIGNIPKKIDIDCEAKFYKAQFHLIQMGYEVINPIERLTNIHMLLDEAKRKNLNDLMFANAVYILPCVILGSGLQNLEIKMALDFNLSIILGTIDLTLEIQTEKLNATIKSN